ncbi:MAG: PorP/SprF family type IX secretion system membrane protein [Bacteroidia bacterium]|nr:PorP/SprF family type IX secretion system membrane protein [Bacteroidia bacterium]
MIHCKKNTRFDEICRVILLFFVLICNSTRGYLWAQSDITISQSAYIPSLLNPGSAGRTGTYQAVGAFKKQWVGIKGAPQTSFLGINGEVAFLKSFHGVGAIVTHDKVGALTTMNIAADYSYHIELDKGLLGLGLRVGVLNTAFKPSELSTAPGGLEDDYHQQTDPLLQGSDESATAVDVGLGAFYQSSLCYLGLSFLHLNAPKMEMNSGACIKRRPLMNIAAGRKLREDASLGIEARTNFMTDFSSTEIDVSLLANLKSKLAVGVGYRLQDAVFFQVGANLSSTFFVGYDYDLCVTDFSSQNSGGHEIILTYTFSVDIERRTKRYKSVRIL